MAVVGPVPGGRPVLDVVIPDSHKPVLAGHASAPGADCGAPRRPARRRRRAPHNRLEAAEAGAAVSAAVARLSPEQRVALLLRELEGLSYDQIAEVLGVSMPAVKSRIYHARVELARDLGAHGLDSR